MMGQGRNSLNGGVTGLDGADEVDVLAPAVHGCHHEVLEVGPAHPDIGRGTIGGVVAVPVPLQRHSVRDILVIGMSLDLAEIPRDWD